MEDLFDEDYDIWLNEERQRQEDYFDNRADEMYEQYVHDYYQKLENDNKFVLVYDTSTVREYIVPGTNVHKVEKLKNNKVICTSYFKSNDYRNEDLK